MFYPPDKGGQGGYPEPRFSLITPPSFPLINGNPAPHDAQTTLREHNAVRLALWIPLIKGVMAGTEMTRLCWLFPYRYLIDISRRFCRSRGYNEAHSHLE